MTDFPTDPALFTEADRLAVARAIADAKTDRGQMPSLDVLRAAVASIRTVRVAFVADNKPAKAPRQATAPKSGGKATSVSIDLGDF